MDERFREMIGTLCEARQAMASELLPVGRARSLDDRHLWQQLKRAKQYEAFADALLVMMAEGGAAHSLAEEAQQLLYFFQATVARIEALLENTPE